MWNRLWSRMLLFFLLTVLLSWGVMAAASTVTTQLDDNTVEIAFLDDQGNPTVNSQGVAYVHQVLNDAGKPILETYFDLQGKPRYLGEKYCGIARQFNEAGQEIRVTYLNEREEPVEGPNGYASITYAYDAQGRRVLEEYWNRAGKPYRIRGKYSACRRDAFDAAGHVTSYSYLDPSGSLVRTSVGYAAVTKVYNERGQEVLELYFDEYRNPTTIRYGEYGVLRGYDEQGRLSTLTYVDAEGKPMVNKLGYTIVRREYVDGRLRYEWYCDAQGNVVETSRGQAGIQYPLPGFSGTKPVDINGNPLFFLDSFLINHLNTVLICAALLFILATVFPRKLRLLLLLAYSVFMLYMTLLSRNATFSGSPVDLWGDFSRMFASRSISYHMLENLVFFLPFGYLLTTLYPNRKMLFLPLLVSGGIELTQMITRLGAFELGDLLSNGLGGLLGGMAGLLLVRMHQWIQSVRSERTSQ